MRKLFPLILILLLSFPFVAQKPSQQVIISQKITVAGGGDFVNDTFTQGSDVNLSSHTGEIGATWTLHSSHSGTAINDATLDRVYCTVSSVMYYASGTPPSANYCVEADFFHNTVTSTNFSIAIVDPATDSAVMLRLNADNTRWEILDRTNGSNGTSTNSATHYIGASSNINARMCRSGTSMTAFFNGVQDTALNFTTAHTFTGKAGIRVSGASTSTFGIHIDNFRAF